MPTANYCVLFARITASDGTNTHRYKYCISYSTIYELGMAMNHNNGNIIALMSSNMGYTALQYFDKDFNKLYYSTTNIGTISTYVARNMVA